MFTNSYKLYSQYVTVVQCLQIPTNCTVNTSQSTRHIEYVTVVQCLQIPQIVWSIRYSYTMFTDSYKLYSQYVTVVHSQYVTVVHSQYVTVVHSQYVTVV